jgi:hypothetical protein
MEMNLLDVKRLVDTLNRLDRGRKTSREKITDSGFGFKKNKLGKYLFATFIKNINYFMFL